MECKKPINLNIKLKITDSTEPPVLHAYLFSAGGKLIQSAPLQKNQASMEVDSDFNGRTAKLILGPPIANNKSAPNLSNLIRQGAYQKHIRVLEQEPLINIKIPGIIFPKWCLCYVKGKLVTYVNVLDGSTQEHAVCNARVHICEVDKWPKFIWRLPERDIFRLRDDLIKKLWPTKIPHLPRPLPDPPPYARLAIEQTDDLLNEQEINRDLTPTTNLNQTMLSSELLKQNQIKISLLQNTQSVVELRRQFVQLSDLILPFLCWFPYLWYYFHKDCLTVVEADDTGKFSTLIAYDCNDKPDIYIWVEQRQNGVWKTIYKPSIACHTYWNYACGSELTIHIPDVEGCEKPDYDLPDGVQLFVLPFAIGHASILGSSGGSAPLGWVRGDGFIDYHSNSGLGVLNDAPFGGTLYFRQDDSYFIPSNDIKYYRYSYRRLGEAEWTPITHPLTRGYRMEYSDRLPTYESYFVGPKTQNAETGLYEFKPLVPPTNPGDPATVVAREWTTGNLGEAAAIWNTNQVAPAISAANISDDAATFEIKIEVFDPDGNKVVPSPTTFQFLLRNTDKTTTRLVSGGEVIDNSFRMLVHVDNNGVSSALPQPSIDGVAASDNCGFLRYSADDLVHVQYHASHPNDHAVFRFGIKRGSNHLSSATTLAPYIEVGATNAPTATSPYVKSSGNYQRDFNVSELVGSCVNAAFAAHLNVYGKATNGYHRLGIHSGELIAFALAEED